MASKSKLKKHELEFKNKCIDLRRFAYDVIKYSALKFGVPESCIAAWEDSDNDYGCSDFCMAVFRSVFRHQILLRYILHAYFKQRYEANKLASFDISRLLQDAINMYTRHPLKTTEDVEISLAIACELVLFIYSKNLNMYLNELAKHWFYCYLHLVKKQFQKAGGLCKMYLKGSRPVYPVEDAFYDKFISVHCLPYQDSVTNRDLKKLHNQLHSTYIEKVGENFVKFKEMGYIFVHESSREGSIKEYEIVMVPVISEKNEASGMNITQNISNGIIQLAADSALSQVFPETSFQNPPHSRAASAQKK